MTERHTSIDYCCLSPLRRWAAYWLPAVLALSAGCSHDSSPDGRAAHWVLRTGGFVEVRGDGEPLRATTAKELPPSPFTVLKIGWLSYPGDQFPDVTDEGIEHLEGLSQLAWLDLSGTAVTDAALERIGRWTSLVELHLNHTGITDAGLEHLHELTELEAVALEGTQTTEAARRTLREKLPRLKIKN